VFIVQMERKPRVVLQGHSYVRLRDFMAEQMHYQNLGLRDTEVTCFGVHGARVNVNSPSISEDTWGSHNWLMRM